MARTPLKAARQEADWTQTELAKEVGAAASTINELENNDDPNPSFKLVTRIVRALRSKGVDVAAEDLFPVPDVQMVDDRRSGADRRQGVA